jgi:hypothetical protein
MTLVTTNGFALASGMFPVMCAGELLDEEFLIQICFPSDFPDSFPTVRVCDPRLPKGPNLDWHILKDDIACLEQEEKLWIEVGHPANVRHFLDKIVNDYFIQQTNKLLTGEYKSFWDHGTEGKLDFYFEMFPEAVRDPRKIHGAISIMLSREIRGHHDCPFCMGQKIRACHLQSLVTARKGIPADVLQRSRRFIQDYIRAKK